MPKSEADKILEWTCGVKSIILTFGVPEIEGRDSLEKRRRRYIDSIIHWFIGMRNFKRKAEYFKTTFESIDKALSKLFTEWLDAANVFDETLFNQCTSIKQYKSITVSDTKKVIDVLFAKVSIGRTYLDTKTHKIAEHVFENYPFLNSK